MEQAGLVNIKATPVKDISSARLAIRELVRNTGDADPVESATAVLLEASIHVAVITSDQILESLKERYFRLKWDPKEQGEGLTNCMTFISGPVKPETSNLKWSMVPTAPGNFMFFF